MTRLLRTSAIRLSLRYSLYYMLVAGAGLSALYWAASRYVDAQLEAGLRNHIDSLAAVYSDKGQAGLAEAIKPDVVIPEPENHRFVLYVDKSGVKLAGDLKGWPAGALPDNEVSNIWIEDSLIPHAIKDHDGYWPGIAMQFPDHSRLLIVQSVQQAEDLQEFILSTLFATLAMIIGLTLILGWRMGRRMLSRIDEVNATAGQILGGHLDRRIPVSSAGDEFDELASKLNAMLDHIGRLIRGMRQVTDNVAHDLRRPLTRLRNRLDVTLLEQRTPETYRESLEASRNDIEDVLKTFNALLEIAQAESGQFRGEIEVLDLSLLVTELGEMYADLFGGKGQVLEIDAGAGICVEGNRQLLAQLISNLLENSHKYAGDRALVGLRLQRDGSSVVLSVSDNGPGIPGHKFQDVLQRYVRLDFARSTPGNGLGLSLVKAIAQLHGARLTLTNNSPGLQVALTFPTTPCPPGD